MKQKRVLLLAVLCCAVAFTAGCKSVTCTTCENHSTLQGTIMDAITGEHIGGVTSGNNMDIQIFLVQGDTIRKPTSFISDETNVLVGEYSFTNIPSGGTDSGDSENNEYKLVVIKKGYQRFEGRVSLVDIDNKIGNVYLFPENYNTPDYTFRVEYNGKPVPSAAVLFKPVVGSNSATAEESDVLAATAGYIPSLTGTTDASGQVVFAGANLSLGAAYKLIVLPTAFESVELAEYQDAAARIVGLSNMTDIIAMSDLSVGTNPYGLYVVSRSNSVDNLIDTTGTLTLTFNRAVELGKLPSVSFPLTTGFGATLSVLPSAAIWPVAPLSRVNASLSSDGLTLTLTPAWTTPPDLTREFGQSITYNDNIEFLSIKGYPDTKVLISTLVDADGTATNRTVHMATP